MSQIFFFFHHGDETCHNVHTLHLVSFRKRANNYMAGFFEEHYLNQDTASNISAPLCTMYTNNYMAGFFEEHNLNQDTASNMSAPLCTMYTRMPYVAGFFSQKSHYL